MKKNVRVIIVALLVVCVMCTMLVSCDDARIEEINEKYDGYEIVSVSSGVYYSSHSGKSTCFIVVAIDQNDDVHTLYLRDSEITFIESGDPYLTYSESNGVAIKTLNITKNDFVNFINN